MIVNYGVLTTVTLSRSRSNRQAMDSAFWAVLLLLVALVLCVAEVFIPSAGLIVIAAAGALLCSIVLAWQAWGGSQPVYFWAFLGAIVVLLPVIVATAFAVWPHTPIGRRAILHEPKPEEIAAFVEQDLRNSRLPGQIGKTLTTMKPTGIVEIDGKRVQCQSEGMIIEAGCIVKVISARGNRVLVRRCSLSETTPSGNAPAFPLDFEIPES